jgi:hypothetical protein
MSSGTLDIKRQTAYQTFLFTIMYEFLSEACSFLFMLMLCSHRTTKLDDEIRLQKLRGFVNPVQHLWQNPGLIQALSSYSGFCELLGLNRVKSYLISRPVHGVADWGLYQLDAKGQKIQQELDDRVKVDLSHFPNQFSDDFNRFFRLFLSELQNLSWPVRRKNSRRTIRRTKSRACYGAKLCPLSFQNF